MAIKKTRFRPKGNDNYETIIHFETSADIVKTTDDSNVQSKLDELKNNYNNILNDIEDIQSDLDSKETPSGAQAKADTAETNAKNYADTIVGIVDRNLETHENNNVQHITSSERTTWNNKIDKAYQIGSNPPSDTNILWIDTSI